MLGSAPPQREWSVTRRECPAPQDGDQHDRREARAARNHKKSLEAFLAKKAEFDALLAELRQASDDHFGADPEAVLWGETAWLTDATAKLREIADQHFKRGEFVA